MMKRMLLLLLILFPVAASAAEPWRLSNLPLSPEQKPNIEVLPTTTLEGELRPIGPDGWRFVPESIQVAPDQKRLVFTVAQGKPDPKNIYPVAVELKKPNGETVRRDHRIFVTTAPNSRLDVRGPDENGNTAEQWNDAIAVPWTESERSATIKTVWNRKRFSVLLEIEGLELTPFDGKKPSTAVQVAIGSLQTDRSPGELYQFLAFADGQEGRLVSLSSPDRGPSEYPMVVDSKTFVWKRDKTVFFEISIPFSVLKAIRPGEGREFTMSLLVHDPTRGEVRDWGRICSAPKEKSETWIRWKGDSIAETPLTAPRTGWCLCSSKY